MTVTTAIALVPAACAALWAPYGVTKVPPVGLLDGTPTPPTVVDETNGAVSQATADAWALALNHVGSWLTWSEATLQYELTPAVEGPQVVNLEIDRDLRSGTAVADPACDQYATSYYLRPVDAALTSFLSKYGEVTQGKYAFSAVYPGPCTITATDATGHTTVVASTAGPVTTLIAGSLKTDPLLGTLWYSDAGGLCRRTGAPQSWCHP